MKCWSCRSESQSTKNSLLSSKGLSIWGKCQLRIFGPTSGLQFHGSLLTIFSTFQMAPLVCSLSSNSSQFRAVFLFCRAVSLQVLMKKSRMAMLTMIRKFSNCFTVVRIPLWTSYSKDVGRLSARQASMLPTYRIWPKSNIFGMSLKGTITDCKLMASSMLSILP